jgi:hypothetical protein
VLAQSPRFLTKSRDPGKNEPMRSRGRLTFPRSPGTLEKTSSCARDVGSLAHKVSGLGLEEGDSVINKPARSSGLKIGPSRAPEGSRRTGRAHESQRNTPDPTAQSRSNGPTNPAQPRSPGPTAQQTPAQRAGRA